MNAAMYCRGSPRRVPYGRMRERHQDGWVVESGKRVKKWIGHWHPYRRRMQRDTRAVVLGLKAKMKKWQAEDKLRAHIAAETKKQVQHPDGEPTLQCFWERTYLPSRTWGPAMKSAVTSVVVRHVLPKFGNEKISALDKLALQQHLNTLAESYSRSLVKKVLMQYRAILEESVEQELSPRTRPGSWPCRRPANPAVGS